MVAEACKKKDLLAVNSVPKEIKLKTVPKVKEQISRAISRIGQYNDLDNKVILRLFDINY